jgi:uncharacterized protein (TIGR03083 family)
METHDQVWQALGAWALDACDDDETRQVVAHLTECPPCREEAGRLRRAADVLGVLGEFTPPPGARGRLLSAALARRPAATPDLRRLVSGYRDQIGELASLLGTLDHRGWAVRVPKHGSVLDLIRHLSGNDHALLSALGEDRADPGPAGWHGQASLLADRLGATRLILRTSPVPLAGPAGWRRPVRDAVVQRMFETWVHADDVRAALDLPRRPPDERAIGNIVDLGVALLPAVLTATGRSHPGMTGMLELTGPGAGTWTVALASNMDDRTVVAELAAETVDFCRLMAGRLAPSALRCTVRGAPGPAQDLLHAASQLGCDAHL